MISGQQSLRTSSKLFPETAPFDSGLATNPTRSARNLSLSIRRGRSDLVLVGVAYWTETARLSFIPAKATLLLREAASSFWRWKVSMPLFSTLYSGSMPGPGSGATSTPERSSSTLKSSGTDLMRAEHGGVPVA